MYGVAPTKALAVPEPAGLIALILTLYFVPFVNPVIRIGVDVDAGLLSTQLTPLSSE